MIAKHRNIGFLQVALAMALTVVLGILIRKAAKYPLNRDAFIPVLFVYLATVTLWMMGGFSLAKAKGHSNDKVGAIFLFLFFVSFCFPGVVFIFPGFVLFGLKDKTRHGRRYH